MGNLGLLHVTPLELKFIFELNRESSCSMQIINKSDKHVAFMALAKTNENKIQKKYCARPNTGVLPPRSTCDVIVTKQAEKDAPRDLRSTDRFWIQSVVVSPRTSADDIKAELFNNRLKNPVEECVLKVSYVLPPPRASLVRRDSDVSSDTSSESDYFTAIAEFEQAKPKSKLTSFLRKLGARGKNGVKAKFGAWRKTLAQKQEQVMKRFHWGEQ